MVKKVLKFALLILLLGVVVVFTSLTILVFAIPAHMAQTFEKLGMQSLAYGCYDRQYRNSTQVDEQYVMMLRAHELSFNSHVVYYGEKLFSNEEYFLLIGEIDKSNIEKTDKYIEENPSLTEREKTRLEILCRNEDNFLSNIYVKALMNLGKEEKAKNFLITQMSTMLEDSRFGANLSFAGTNYIAKTKTLPSDLLAKIESFTGDVEENLSYNESNILIDNKVSFQRLVEISNVLATHYTNAGDAETSAKWQAKAQTYLNLIYS